MVGIIYGEGGRVKKLPVSGTNPGNGQVVYLPKAQGFEPGASQPMFCLDRRPWTVRRFWQRKISWESATRKPMLLLKLSGLFLLRTAQRALFRLLFQEPPRTTRSHGLSRLGIRFFPSSQQSPDFSQHRGNMLILIHFDQLQILAETKVLAQQCQLNIRLVKIGASIAL